MNYKSFLKYKLNHFIFIQHNHKNGEKLKEIEVHQIIQNINRFSNPNKRKQKNKLRLSNKVNSV
jgi:hypothetical protein